jgi:hypothetical protein
MTNSGNSTRSICRSASCCYYGAQIHGSEKDLGLVFFLTTDTDTGVKNEQVRQLCPPADSTLSKKVSMTCLAVLCFCSRSGRALWK